MPAHTHTTALHQAVLQENVALLRLLLANGASTERRDTLWDATPLQWAIHQDRPIARKLLEQT
jgi:ankyrin repeat protein